MKKRKRRISLLPIIIIICVFLFLVSREAVTNAPNELEGGIYIIDVGQGDSSLLVSGETAMLVDAGTNSSEDMLISYLNELGIKKLDALILTHPHEDHIGGADAVIENFEVAEVIMPDATANTKTFESVLDAAEQRKVPISIVVRGDKFDVGDIKLHILSPREKGYGDLNNSSIVFTAELGGVRAMFTGDAEALVEKELLKKFDKSELDCDFLKVAHHGSSTSSTREFIKVVSPRLASISCGLDNSYGHPHRETRELFDELGLEYYRTDTYGNMFFEIKNGEIERES